MNPTRFLFPLFTTLLFVMAVQSQLIAQIRYVKTVASGTGDGSSWANASDDLQAMINAAGVTQVWVAAGTYKPLRDRTGNATPADLRTKAFVLKNGVAVYGGFNGSEGLVSERNWRTNETTLSGDIGIGGDKSDNSYHVVHNDFTSSPLGSSAVLDGFTVTGGNANGATNANQRGAGMYNVFASATISNCSFTGNEAAARGGAMYNDSSEPDITNCNFSGNSSTNGGAMYNLYASPGITNCIFIGNTASANGGGIYNSNNASYITNCSFSGNSAGGTGGGIYNTSSTPVILNCIIWGNSSGIQNESGSNPTVAHSVLQMESGVFPGAGNLNEDPMFVSQPPVGLGTSGDLNLLVSSFSIDAGVNAAVPAGITTDYEGNPRIVNIAVDMGAYEYQGTRVSAWCYADNDGDGYGDPTKPRTFQNSCGVGYVSNSTDCDDANNAVNPTATEVCDGLDNNCDGIIDEGLSKTYYRDADNDGYGDPMFLVYACVKPAGYVEDNTDCDDTNQFSYPGATEICDGSDNDCDGQVDEGVLETFYRDGDADSFGDPANSVAACFAPSGYVADSTDCDDLNFDINPGVTEVCDGIDNNCNGQVDEGVLTTWYRDADNDGYGNPLDSVVACTAPPGYVADNTDCHDLKAHVNPGMPEICNNGDDDCDGLVDEGLSSTWYQDADNDGYGNASVSVLDCSVPPGFVADNTDCDDSNNTINPGAAEICNRLDDNCNGLFDEGVCTYPIRYVKTVASGISDGSSWADASSDIQAMIDAPSVEQVWVAAGTYYPIRTPFNKATLVPDPRTPSFVMKNNVAIYGGFTGTETALTERNWTTNVTTLSGDTGVPGDNSDNLYNVIYNEFSAASPLNNTAILDGFVITGGNANSISPLIYSGAGMFNLYSSPTIMHCSFNENFAALGGGMSNEFSSPVINSCEFSSNSAPKGAGIFNNNSSPNLSNCIFSGNRGTTGTLFLISYGGAMDNFNSNPVLTECVFVGNSAVTGGAMFSEQSSIELTDCDFYSNRADQAGAVYNDRSTAVFEDCNFTGNTAEMAGAMYNDTSTVTIERCMFNANTALLGGAMANDSARVTIVSTQFHSNEATLYHGGAIVNFKLSVGSYTNCSFSGNASNVEGGAVFHANSSPSYINCSFLGNKAETQGGGIANQFSSPEIINCSLSGNSAPTGGAIINLNVSNPAISNSIIWGNSTGVDDDPTSFPGVTYSIVQMPAGVYPGMGNLNANPLFVSQPPVGHGTSGDLHLQTGSPAIDAGNNADVPPGVITDLDGNPRLLNSRVDMGAYEYQGTWITCYLDADGDFYGNPAFSMAFLNTCGPGYVYKNTDCDDSNNAINPGAAEICNGIDDNCNGLIDINTDPRFEDNIPPALICQSTIVELDATGNGRLRSSDIIMSALDNCGIIILNPAVPNIFNCTQKGPNSVLLTVEDGNGNSTTCTTIVMVVDRIPPVLVCKSHTLVLNETGTAVLSPLDIYQSHTDNCNSINLISVTPNTFTCMDAGKTITASLTAVDQSLNVSTCTTQIFIEDRTPPSLSCRNFSVTLDADGFASITPADILLSVGDNCGVGTFSLSESTFNCSRVGTNSVKLTVVDQNGNEINCVADVEVLANPAFPDGKPEICDGIDNDCDGLIDEGFDTDGDGFTVCGGDCDDKNAAIYPGAAETCNMVDDNCNGLIDEGVVPTWYADTDGDGFGNPVMTTMTCMRPAGYVANNLDCNDSDAGINPDAIEICDSIDNNCNGVVDEGATERWYQDLDGDGYGNLLVWMDACTRPEGYVKYSGDCDDLDPTVTGSAEVCNGLDDDCDGVVDEGVKTRFYFDNDGDGFGDNDISMLACEAPPLYVAANGDCNDSNPKIHPGAPELCNGKDDNCNGLIDDGISDLVYPSHVTFMRQDQLDRWKPCWGSINGDMTIMFPGVVDLTPLSNIKMVTGNVTIKYTWLTNLNGLDSLHIIGGNLFIHDNGKLENLNGLEGLTSIGGGLGMIFNRRLAGCCPIYPLLVSGGIRTYRSISVNSFGCNSEHEINTICSAPIIGLRSGAKEQSSKVFETPTQKITLFPNPASDRIYVLMEKPFETGVLQIIDNLGKTIIHQNLDGFIPFYEIETSSLASGIYYVRLKVGALLFTDKLIVE